jgi:hypothetical protein
MFIDKEFIESYAAQLEIKKLVINYEDVKDSPWAIYNSLTIDEVLRCNKEKGYLAAKELIRRSDIRAYRAEEAACGNI